MIYEDGDNKARARLFAGVFTTPEGKRVLEILAADAKVGQVLGDAGGYKLGRHDAIASIIQTVREGLEEAQDGQESVSHGGLRP